MGQPRLLDVLEEREERYEVIDGHVVVSPPARLAHERLVPRLSAALLSAAPAGFEVLGPNFAVRYDPQASSSFVLPDLLVARSADCDELGISVAPLLVAEVLSPGTRRRDRGEKRDIYAELGVPTSWIVDPDALVLEVWELQDSTYVRTASGATLHLTAPYPLIVDLTGSSQT